MAACVFAQSAIKLISACAGVALLASCETPSSPESVLAPQLVAPVSQASSPDAPPADAAPADMRPAPVLAESTQARLGENTARTSAATSPTPEVVPAPSPQSDPSGFIDRFPRAALDDRWYVHHRDANGDWAANDWRKESVRVTPGLLSLVMTKSGRGSKSPYSSGEISTYDQYQFGYFESRFKVPRGAGVVTAFFSYVREDGTNATWNELDIEILGRSTTSMDVTIHADGTSIGKSVELPFDAADGFHSYGIEWLPDVVRWYVDNEVIHEVTGPAVQKLRRRQNVFIDVYGSEKLNQWVGDINPDEAPWTLEISCIAYQPEYQGRSMCPAEG